MVDQIIRPSALPRRSNPVASEIAPVDNGVQVAGSTLVEIVNAGAPVASQPEAEAGSNNTKRMTPLTTKQSIASEVGVTIASKAQGDKADNAAPNSRSISAGTGLSGGGDLTENRMLSLSSSSIASLAKADTAVQPGSLGALAFKSSINNSDWSGAPLAPQNGGVVPGGTIGQAYIKASGDDYDGSWQDVAAATAVSYAPQVLNESQKSQARDNIDSASRADTRRNRIVNGDKLVSQENGQTSGTANGRYISDQNAMFFVTSNGVFTGVNVAGRTSPAGGNRDRITITTPDTVLAAGEFLTYTQNIEGSNVGDLKWGTANAVPLIVRRGIRAPQGTWPVAFHNSVANRSYVTTFTVSAGQANTDLVHEFAIPGDTTGTWLTADGVIGLTMDFVIGAGSTFQGASGWQAGNMLTVSGATNGMGLSGAVFEFFDEGMKADPASTGVYGQYEVGEVDAVYRSARYLERIDPNAGASAVQSALYSGTNSACVMPIIEKSKPPTTSPTVAAAVSRHNRKQLAYYSSAGFSSGDGVTLFIYARLS